MKEEPDYKLPSGGYIWVISEHRGWGDSFNLQWEKHRINGHISKPRCVKEGDIIHIPFENGKTGAFYMKNVDNMRDPRDMFFADLVGIDYINELLPESEINSDQFKGMVKYGIKAMPGMTIN